jgi:hypothetical protein
MDARSRFVFEACQELAVRAQPAHQLVLWGDEGVSNENVLGAHLVAANAALAIFLLLVHLPDPPTPDPFE